MRTRVVAFIGTSFLVAALLLPAAWAGDGHIVFVPEHLRKNPPELYDITIAPDGDMITYESQYDHPATLQVFHEGGDFAALTFQYYSWIVQFNNTTGLSVKVWDKEQRSGKGTLYNGTVDHYHLWELQNKPLRPSLYNRTLPVKTKDGETVRYIYLRRATNFEMILFQKGNRFTRLILPGLALTFNATAPKMKDALQLTKLEYGFNIKPTLYDQDWMELDHFEPIPTDMEAWKSWVRPNSFYKDVKQLQIKEKWKMEHVLGRDPEPYLHWIRKSSHLVEKKKVGDILNEKEVLQYKIDVMSEVLEISRDQWGFGSMPPRNAVEIFFDGKGLGFVYRAAQHAHPAYGRTIQELKEAFEQSQKGPYGLNHDKKDLTFDLDDKKKAWFSEVQAERVVSFRYHNMDYVVGFDGPLIKQVVLAPTIEWDERLTRKEPSKFLVVDFVEEEAEAEGETKGEKRSVLDDVQLKSKSF